jgi:hypothetical protein
MNWGESALRKIGHAAEYCQCFKDLLQEFVELGDVDGVLRFRAIQALREYEEGLQDIQQRTRSEIDDSEIDAGGGVVRALGVCPPAEADG